ncbi:beta family protein [Lysinibacillus fusiformis]|uniref:beta family protein n=1 Tax=Lysinibacillus fusiformis TaxID=28031 RepID=UPI003019E528
MTKLTYVPVLRYRAQERKTLTSTTISSKIVPLIEIITEKLKSNSKKDAISQLIEDTTFLNTKIMLDFPMYITLKKQTQPTVITFLQPILANPNTRINLFKDPRIISESHRIIPVLTYNPYSPTIAGQLTNQSQKLRSDYSQQSFRIFQHHFDQAIQELSNIVTDQDIVMFDIDETSHTHAAFKRMYTALNQLSSSVGCEIVLIRSAIPSDLTNVGLDNGKIVYEADNSILTEYKKLGFSAFGDYCGVKKDDLTKGGRISPGYIIYSWKDNSYYGFKGVLEDASSFERVLVPALLKSSVWRESSTSHMATCLGCSTIEKIHLKQKKGNAQPEWKGFACGHYLYTMEEFL